MVEENNVEVDESTFHRVFTCLSDMNYFHAEREAHDRARERLAYIDGKRVPYMVKMSVYAPKIDRSKYWLEDDFKPARMQADVIVFKDVEQKKEFIRNGRIVYMKFR